MEQKKIDIAELLIDAPKGTLLYSPICGEVELRQSSNADGYIEVKDSRDEVLEFFRDGRYDMFGESLLFPSKDVQDWNVFNVKYVKMSGEKEIDDKLKLLLDIDHPILNDIEYLPDTILYRGRLDNEVYENRKDDEEYNYILSTGTELKLEEKEEKQTKFKKGDEVVILNEKQTGSTPMTHIVEEEADGIVYMDNYCYGMFVGGVALAKAKEQPKFKVGDVIKSNTGLIGMIDRKAITGDYIATDGQNEYAIIKATATLATPEEITKWNKEVLEPNHLHYSKSKRKIIHWFLPFDKVIVKEEKETHWRADFFSNKEDEWYCCMSGNYEHCLPYNDKTAKLIGTADDYEED